MTESQTLSAASTPPRWIVRLQFCALIALTFALLYFAVSRPLLAAGTARPVVPTTSFESLPAALAISALLLGLALIVRLVLDDPLRGVAAVLIGVALWLTPSGNIDQWLTLRNVVPGPATAASYAPLLVEHLLWSAVFVVMAILAGVGGRTARQVFALDQPAKVRAAIVQNLLLTTALGLVLILILMGPRGETHRGQVYFAVAVGFLVAGWLAHLATHVEHPLAYWPAPVLAGFVALLFSIWKPMLPPPYDHLNNIPAWGFARPLPIEMIAVGGAACLWAARSAHQHHRAPASG